MRFAAGNVDLYFESVLSTVYFESAQFPGIGGVLFLPVNNQVEFPKTIVNYRLIACSLLLSPMTGTQLEMQRGAVKKCVTEREKKGFMAELET